jgi:hypothetical protein
MNRNSATKYIPARNHVCHVSSTRACHTTLFQNTLRHSPLRGRNPDAHVDMNSLFAVIRGRILTRKAWLKPLRVFKKMQLRRVLLPYRSPSAKDTRLRKLATSPFSNISGNGVRLNGITTRGKEDLLAISRRFIFPSRKRRNRTSRLQC